MHLMDSRSTNRRVASEAFSGLSARHAKRRALGYWYTHRGELGMTVNEFFARCRLSSDGGFACITFYGDRPVA